MGIETLAVLPACVGGVALLIIIISGLRNIRNMFKAVSFSVVLTACTTAILFATVFVFEFLRIANVGELFYLGAVGFVIHAGLRYGRMKLGFTNRVLVLQGIIAVCGCAAAALCFLGWTVKI